jgi:predicted N-acetyltransferase YhbS
MMGIEVRLLRPDDERRSFRSGDPDLDRFFYRFAGQNQFKHHIGTTWIAVEDGRIVGYATVSASHIEIKDLPPAARKGLPDYPLPVLRLARLAVSERDQGKGVGRVLLRAVFLLTHEMAARYGSVGVVVDAKPGAVSYYERYGFEALEVTQGTIGERPEPQAMFLPLSGIPDPSRERSG